MLVTDEPMVMGMATEISVMKIFLDESGTSSDFRRSRRREKRNSR